jgi:hypothetical protein
VSTDSRSWGLVVQESNQTLTVPPQTLPRLSLSPRTTAEPTLCIYRHTPMGASRPGEQPNPDRASTGPSGAEPVAQDDSRTRLATPGKPTYACLSPRTTAEPTLCAYRLTSMGASRPGEQPNPDRASTGLPRLSLSPRTTAEQDLPPPANPRMRACRPGRQLNPRCASTDSRSWGLVVQDDLR